MSEIENGEQLTKRQKEQRRQELKDVIFILSSSEGRRFFWRYLTFCGVFRTTFTGNNQTFFKEGERNIGLSLFADMNEAVPEAYAVMQREFAEEQQRRKLDEQSRRKKQFEAETKNENTNEIKEES